MMYRSPLDAPLIRLILLVGSLLSAHIAKAQNSTPNEALQQRIDGLDSIAEIHFEAAEYEQYQGYKRSVDKLLREADPVDSLTITHVRQEIASAYYLAENATAAYYYIDSALLYAPNTTAGESRRTELLLQRISFASAAGLVGDIYRTIGEAMRSVIDDPLIPTHVKASMHSFAAFQSIEYGYLNAAEEYLAEGRRIHERLTPEEAARSSIRFDVEYNLVKHLIAMTRGDTAGMTRYRTAMQQFANTHSLTPIEANFYGRLLISEVEYYLTLNDGDAIPELQAQLAPLIHRVETLGAGNNRADYAQLLQRLSWLALEREGQLTEALAAVEAQLQSGTTEPVNKTRFIADQARLLLKLSRWANAYPAIDSLAASAHTGEQPLLADYSNFEPGEIMLKSGFLVDIGNQLLTDRADERAYQRADQLFNIAYKQFAYGLSDMVVSRQLAKIYEPLFVGRIQLAKGDPVQLAKLIEDLETIDATLTWRSFLLNRSAANERGQAAVDAKRRALYAASAAAKQGRETDQLRKRLQLEAFEDSLRQLYPYQYAISQPQLKVAELQDQLAVNELILKYRVLQGAVYRFSIGKDRLAVDRLAVSGADLQRLVAATVSGSRPEVTDLDGSRILLPEQLNGIDRLTIIPDGALTQLPFEVLKVNERPLIEQMSVSYLPYLIFKQLPAVETNAKTDLLAIAPVYDRPAPDAALALRDDAVALAGAAAESAYLTDLFGGTLITAADRAKAAFLDQAPDARLLHLAMHARIDNEQPELSYFDFGGDSLESSRLYVEELYGLNLGADLAVLSACNTGRGQIDETKGLVSLHRAFTYAGVPATVASLWAVPDAATATIMERFYTRLHAGEAKDEALRGAKLDYLAATTEPALRAPLYWAGFVLYGDPAPVRVPGWGWWWMLPVGLVLGVGVWLYVRSRG